MSRSNPTPADIAKVCKIVRRDIVAQGRWIKGTWSQVVNGAPKKNKATNTCKTQFCLAGGILFHSVQPINRVQIWNEADNVGFERKISTTPLAAATMRAIADTLDAQGQRTGGVSATSHVVSWNDATGRTAQEVERVLLATERRLLGRAAA